MSTVTQLVATIDAFYPNAETTANKIIYMNLAQDIISPYFGKVVEDATLSTVQNIDSYSYPTNLTDVSEIISLAIHNVAKLYSGSTAYVAGDIVYYNANTYTCILASTGNLPTDTTYFTLDTINRYNYTQYYLNRSEENPASEYGYFQIINSSGAKKLCIYPVPSATGLVIIIRYKKKLTALSSGSMSAEPDFDSRYHVMLAYYATAMMCSVGASPDSYQADHFMKMFDDELDALWKFKYEQDKAQKKFKRDNPHWHSGRSFHSGY